MDRVLSHLQRSMEASQAAKDRALLDSGLTKAQYNALLLLERGHGSTATQLAAACGVTQQAMSRTVNRLVEAKFVEESSSPHGGRSRVLSMGLDPESWTRCRFGYAASVSVAEAAVS